MTTPQTADVVAWGGRSTAIPTNWLLCNGAAVSRTTYADLFAAIGTTFGAGDGSTTFNLPQVSVKFPRGAATPSTGGGTVNHTHTGPTHAHTVTQAATHADHASGGAHTHDSHTTVVKGTVAATQSTLTGPTTHSSTGAHTHAATAHTHSGAAANSSTPGATGTNNPPYLQFHYIIRI